MTIYTNSQVPSPTRSMWSGFKTLHREARRVEKNIVGWGDVGQGSVSVGLECIHPYSIRTPSNNEEIVS